VQSLLKALLDEGYAVQLAHVPKETTFEEHGFVKVKASSGEILAEDADFQHNRAGRSREERVPTLMRTVKGDVNKKETAGKVPVPSDSDSTAAGSDVKA